MSKIAVILVNYKNNLDTELCLDSLGAQTTKHRLLPIVVNVQTKPTDKMTGHYTRPIHIQLENNPGLDHANNLGIETAAKHKTKYLVVLNNDTKLAPSTIEELIAPLEKDASVGFVSPKIYFYPGSEFHHDSYTKNQQGSVIWYAGGIIDWQSMYASHWGVDELDLGQHNQARVTDFCTGCCTATSLDRINAIGNIPTGYFLYWEDVAWSIRAKRAGFKCLYQPSATLWHKNAGSTHGSGSQLHQYYQTRNRLHFGLRYAPMKTKLSMIKEAIKHASNNSEPVKKAVRDAMIGRRGKKHE